MREEREKAAHDAHEAHEALARRIDGARARLPGKKAPEKRRISGSELGLRLVLDMAAAMTAGLLLGWGIDRLFDSSPCGMIVGAMLGIGAGIRNVMHTAALVSDGEKGEDGDGK